MDAMTTDSTLAAVQRMERFVLLVVAGGLSLVAGLWLVTLFERVSPPWSLGLGLVVVGIASLGGGIASQVTVDR